MEYKRIEELTSVVTGGTPSTSKVEYWDDGDIPWLQSGCCQNCDVYEAEKYITQIGYDNSSTRMMPVDTVMIALTGATAGKIGYLNFEACGNQSITGILPCDELNQRYLYFYLISQRNKILADCIGGAQPHISQGYVKNMRVPVPTKEEQQSIVEKLKGLTVIISQRQKEIELLDDLIKARFVEMFGDPKTNDKGFTKAPMGEYMTLLTDFSSNGSYKTLDSGVTMYDEPNYAWMVRTTDLESGDMSSIKYIDEKAYELLSKSKIFGGEIIMNKIGSAGKVYLMPEIDMPASLGRNAFMFRYDDRINVRFLFEQLVSEYGQAEIQQYVRGAVTKTITKDDARSVLIIVPEKELQDEFVKFVKQVDKSKVAVQKVLDETQLLFDSLMQEYFG